MRTRQIPPTISTTIPPTVPKMRPTAASTLGTTPRRRRRPRCVGGVTGVVLFCNVISWVPFVESSSSTSVSYTSVLTDGSPTPIHTVQKDAYDYYEFSLSALMDVDVRLDVSSGDADLYVSKPCSSSSACDPPGDGAGEHDWASYHGSGADEVFIHRRDLTASNDVGAAKMFRIAVHGWASHGSQYTLSVEAIANERAMDAAHKTALDTIFAKCCGSDECESWRSIRAGSDDLCHTSLARCDANNQTTTLNFQQDEMECELTAADFAPFANSLERLYFKGSDDALSMANGFSGILASLTSLSDFVVDGVDLQGEELTGVCNHTNLVRLQATGCNITGLIPSCVMSMSALEYLGVAENELTGTVPDALGAGSRLRIIDLRSQKSSASLTGSFPGSFASQDALEFVHMSGLKLSGSLPDSFSNSSRIRYFDLHDNEFSGGIPPSLGAIPHMETLWLADNAFSGAVPSGIYDHPSRVEVNLNSNELTTLSVTSSYSTPGESLLYFLASDNRINEVGIPTIFTTMDHLQLLFLAGNELRGSILPSQPIPQWDDLRWIDVHDNAFTGALPGASYWGSIFTNVPYSRGYNFGGNAFDADSLVWLQDYGGVSTIPSDGNVYAPTVSELEETSSGRKQMPKFFLGLVMTGMAFLSLFSAAALLHFVRSRHNRRVQNSFQTFVDEEHNQATGHQRVEMAYRVYNYN